MSQGGEDAAGQVVHSLRGRGEAEAHRGGPRHCHRCRLIFFCTFFAELQEDRCGSGSPDPSFYFDADPDPIFHVVPDPDPNVQIIAENLEKVLK